MSNYITLFEVRLHQKFFDEFTRRDLEIIPAAETVVFMSAYHLLFKQIPEGFVVLLNSEKQFLLETNKEELRLVFYLKNANRHFESFTQLLPINPVTKYFFHNLRPPDPSGATVNQVRLHDGEEAGDTEIARFALSGTDPREWLGTQNITLEQQGVKIFDSETPTMKPFVLSNDLEKGWFICRSKDTGEEVRGCKIDDSSRLAFGVIELHVGGTGLVAFEKVKGTKYQIRFSNRQIYWHYYLIAEKGPPPEDVEIFCGKDKLPFSAPEMVRLINGQFAARVTSNLAMPLKSVYGDVLYRAEYTVGSADSLLATVRRQIYLPTPDATRVKGRRNQDVEEYFWETFVYL